MNLRETMAAVGTSMKTEFEILSSQYVHRGLRGAAREDTVKDFLARFLPGNVEIVSGEIFDSTGAHSPESDVIILDRINVPLMFDSGKRLVPIEGVYCILEVKSHLDAKQLTESLEKCAKVKSLEKVAYYPQQGAIINVTNAYGKEFNHFPTLFSIFAYHGINPTSLVSTAEEFCDNRTEEQTLDSVICLDGWVLCWWNPTSDQYDLIRSPGSRLAIVEANENALLFYYLLLNRWISQATCRPIRMTDYLKDSHIANRVYPTMENTNG